MTISAPDIAKYALAGQFVILRTDEFGERIPLTVFDSNKSLGSIDIIYQKVGATTFKLDQKQEGDYIQDIVGPLGKPSEVLGYKNAIVVAGGVGSAIACPVAKALAENGCRVTFIAGFRNKEIIILKDYISNVSHECRIMTDDGSNGNKGFVTNELENKLSHNKNYDLVFAVGPVPMMKAVCDMTKKFGIKTVVSMTSIMIDGTGMCGGCRLTVGGNTKFACVDGPEFDGHLVDFDEAIARNRAFAREENAAGDKYCNLLKGVKI